MSFRQVIGVLALILLMGGVVAGIMVGDDVVDAVPEDVSESLPDEVTDVITEIAGPEPYVGSGVELDAETVASQHSATLSDESFTSESAIRIGDVKAGTGAHSDITVTVDQNSGAYLKETESTFTQKSVYTDAGEGRTVIRVQENGEVTYQSGTEPYSNSDVSPIVPTEEVNADFLAEFIGDTEYTMDGVKMHNGVEVTSFTTDSTDSYTESGNVLSEGQSIESFESEFLVANEDVYVPYFYAELDVYDEREDRTSTIQIQFTVSDRGDVSVEEPAWLGNAE